MGSGHLLSCSLCSELPQAEGCVLELATHAGPGLGHLQALNPSHASPSANTLPVPTSHQAVPRQCGPSGSCRHWMEPVFPSDPHHLLNWC